MEPLVAALQLPNSMSRAVDEVSNRQKRARYSTSTTDSLGFRAMDELQERLLEECADWANPSLTAGVPIEEKRCGGLMFSSLVPKEHIVP